jgi:hypothetical protein
MGEHAIDGERAGAEADGVRPRGRAQQGEHQNHFEPPINADKRG